jgi:hypothetical protein
MMANNKGCPNNNASENEIAHCRWHRPGHEDQGGRDLYIPEEDIKTKPTKGGDQRQNMENFTPMTSMTDTKDYPSLD